MCSLGVLVSIFIYQLRPTTCFQRFTNYTKVMEGQQESFSCSFICQVFQDTLFFFFLIVAMGCLWDELKCLPQEIGKETNSSCDFFFSSASWVKILGKVHHFPSSHQVLLIVLWPVIPLSNRNLLLTLFNPGCFIHQHGNPGRGVLERAHLFVSCQWPHWFLFTFDFNKCLLRDLLLRE